MLEDSKDELQNVNDIEEIEEVEEIENALTSDEDPLSFGLSADEYTVLSVRRKSALFILGIALFWLLGAIVFSFLETDYESIVINTSVYISGGLFFAFLILAFFVNLGSAGAMMFAGLLQGLAGILNLTIIVIALINLLVDASVNFNFYIPNIVLLLFCILTTITAVIIYRELVGAKLIDVEAMMREERSHEYENIAEADFQMLNEKIASVKKIEDDDPESIRSKKLAAIFASAKNYGVSGAINAGENTMIAVDNLTKFYGPTKALNSVSFGIEKNEIIGFLGPNGAGKSTAMKILTTFIPSSSGTAWVAGFNIHKEPLEVRKRIGYLPETTPLYKQMKVVDYLKFAMKARNVPSDRQTHNLYWVREACGLKPVWNMFIGELSKGYKQRVGLAQAMIHEPEILILDEPSSGLDPNQIIEIRSLIKEIAKEKTVILSTHILQEVTAICTRILVINQGKLVANGTIDELSRALSPQGQYILQLDAPGEKAVQELRTIEGVLDVQVLYETENKPLTLIVLPQIDIDAEKLSPSIVQTCVKNNWALIEMKREFASLEDVFVSLTSSDDSVVQDQNDQIIV